MPPSMLTTIDNPFDPFTQYDEWERFDHSHEHYSAELLAREVRTSDELSEEDMLLDIERAIDEIVKINASGVHIKVSND